MPARLISYLKFLFVLAQLGAAVIVREKHETTCSLRIVRQLLFCSLI